MQGGQVRQAPCFARAVPGHHPQSPEPDALTAPTGTAGRFPPASNATGTALTGHPKSTISPAPKVPSHSDNTPPPSSQGMAQLPFKTTSKVRCIRSCQILGQYIPIGRAATTTSSTDSPNLRFTACYSSVHALNTDRRECARVICRHIRVVGRLAALDYGPKRAGRSYFYAAAPLV
jgi:hypothetical protein